MVIKIVLNKDDVECFNVIVANLLHARFGYGCSVHDRRTYSK